MADHTAAASEGAMGRRTSLVRRPSRRSRFEGFIKALLFAAAAVSVAVTLAIIFSLVKETIAFFGDVPIADYLFGTAIWFWMTPQSGGAGVCHQAIMQGNFGQTTRIINGIECINPTPATQLNRAKYYTELAAGMGITAPNQRLYCP